MSTATRPAPPSNNAAPAAAPESILQKVSSFKGRNGESIKSTSPQPKPAPATSRPGASPQSGVSPGANPARPSLAMAPQSAAPAPGPVGAPAHSPAGAPAPGPMGVAQPQAQPRTVTPQAQPRTVTPQAAPQRPAPGGAPTPQAVGQGPRQSPGINKGPQPPSVSPASGAKKQPSASPAAGSGPRPGVEGPAHPMQQQQNAYGGAGAPAPYGGMGSMMGNPYNSTGMMPFGSAAGGAFGSMNQMNNGSMYDTTNSFFNQPGSMMQQQYSLGQQGFGSMGQGQLGQYNSMMGAGGMGSMGPGGMGSMGPGGMGSMGPGGMASMGPGGMGSMGPGGMGSMGPGGMGSMYGPMGSNYGMNSAYGPMGGSMYGNSMMGSMYRPAGSAYGMQPALSGAGFAAQWGSLANLQDASDGQKQRSTITSAYNGFKESSVISVDDLCPNIGTWEDARTVKRSGKRGGNHLYFRDKSDKNAPLVSSNAYAASMSIKKKAEPGSSSTGSIRATARTAGAPSSGSNPRAKVPSHYNVRTLMVVDKAAGGNAKLVSMKDPNTVVYGQGGKKETFECEEAIERSAENEDIDSVLLSELRANWFGGHNSSLLVTAGKGKMEASYNVVRSFLKRCCDRLQKNEKDNDTKFEISINMVAIKGAERGCDLMKDGSGYEKLKLGSSPVFGPCLLDLESVHVKSTEDCIKTFNKGVEAAKDDKEIILGFFVLKQTKKASAEQDVYLASLCIGLFREQLSHIVDLKDKASASPHKLFRYALGGPCITVAALCIDEADAKVRDGLEVQRKVRDVKNRPPRTGNLGRFIEYTEKEITVQKEKAESASNSEKKQREAQINRMEDMVADVRAMLKDPEGTKPKGYAM